MMSIASNVTKLIKEGQAQLQVPKTVFYNPAQEFNRDLSVLVLKTYLKHKVWHHKREEKHVTARGGMRILDALSASGLRSIRYAKELGMAGEMVKTIVANDLSETAVELIKKNIELNNVQDKVQCSHSDALDLLNSSSKDYDQRFHVIDLDPFGTGAQFFDAAVRTIGEAGLLMVTCTDTAVLCGNASESSFARYGSMSLRGEFCHESALRIILRSLEQHASVYGRYIKPLLSVSADFYVRLFLQVFSQQAETKMSASKLSQVYQCKQCKTCEFNKLGSHEKKKDPKQVVSQNLAVKYKFSPGEVKIGTECHVCGGRYILGGPLWSEAIHDRTFLKLLKDELALEDTEQHFATYRRLQGLIQLCSEELSQPLSYSLKQMSSILSTKVPRARDVLSGLVNAGYEVSRTHTNPDSVKTNAPSSVVWGILCQIIEQQQQQQQKQKELKCNKNDDDSLVESCVKNESIAMTIMKRRPSDRVHYDLTYTSAVEFESQKLLRFQMNPTKQWGPMSRPVSGKEEEEEANDDLSSKDLNKEQPPARGQKRPADDDKKDDS